MRSHDAMFSKKAIDAKLHSIMLNNTWVLVDLPQGCKIISYKWIFRKKLKLDGIVEKYKA